MIKIALKCVLFVLFFTSFNTYAVDYDYLINKGPYSIYKFDINNDGFDDSVVVSNESGGKIYVFYNKKGKNLYKYTIDSPAYEGAYIVNNICQENDNDILISIITAPNNAADGMYIKYSYGIDNGNVIMKQEVDFKYILKNEKSVLKICKYDNNTGNPVCYINDGKRIENSNYICNFKYGD